MTAIPGLRSLRQEDSEPGTSLGYIARPYLKNLLQQYDLYSISPKRVELGINYKMKYKSIIQVIWLWSKQTFYKSFKFR